MLNCSAGRLFVLGTPFWKRAECTMFNDKAQLVVIAVFQILMVFVYGKYRRARKETFSDPFMTQIGVGDLDGWSLWHLVTFALLGYIYPTEFWFSMTLGTIWELIEWQLGSTNAPEWIRVFAGAATPDASGRWWYGRVSDIVMNALGFGLGILLSIG